MQKKKKKPCARQKNFGASTDGETDGRMIPGLLCPAKETDDTRFTMSRKGEEVQTVLRLCFISKSIV